MRAFGTGRGRIAVIVVAIAATGGWGCGAPREREAAGSESESAGGDATVPAPEAPGAAIFAVYEGTLPCADCEGIRTELTLLTDGSTFELVETYLATNDGDRTIESSGTWSTITGTPDDPTATVFKLDTRESQPARNYLLASENEIRLLDQDMKQPESGLNYSLTRKSAPPAS